MDIKAPQGIAPVAPLEPAAPVAPAPPKQDEDVSRRFAALSREKRKLFEDQQRFKNDAKEWEEWKNLKGQAKQKPLDYLKAAGLSPDDLVQHLLQEGEPQSVDAKIKALQTEMEREREERSNAEKARLETEKASRESAAIDSFKGKIREYLGQDISKYEAINTLEVQDLVWDRIRTNYDETGEFMPISQAADALEEEILAGAKKLMALKKLAPQDASQTPPLPSPKDTPLAQTLTNNLTSQPRTPSGQFKSREDSLKAAARMLQFKD